MSGAEKVILTRKKILNEEELQMIIEEGELLENEEQAAPFEPANVDENTPLTKELLALL